MNKRKKRQGEKAGLKGAPPRKWTPHLAGVADVHQCGSARFSWSSVHRDDTCRIRGDGMVFY